MFCSQCGHQLPQAVKFCSFCGRAIDAQDEANQISDAPTFDAADAEKEHVRHVQKSISIALSGPFKAEIEEEFKKLTRTKRFEETLCDLIFTDKYLYLLPATKDKSGWHAISAFAGPLYGLADYFVEKAISASQNNQKRPLELSETIDSDARQAIPHWGMNELSLSVFEQSEGFLLNKTNAVNLVVTGPCHFRSRTADCAAQFKFYGSILNPGSFGFGYTRPAEFDPIAKLFGLSPKDIQVR